MAFTRANQSHWLKQVFPASSQVVDIIGVKKGRFLNMMNKSKKGFGESYDIGMEYSRMVSAGANFTNAQNLASSTATEGVKFSVNEVTDYAIERIQGNLMRKTKASDEGMVKKKLADKAARAFNTAYHRASWLVYGGGYGKLGTVSSDTTVSGDTLILNNPSDSLKFDRNMKLVLADTEAGDTLHSSAATLTVSSVSRIDGNITMTAADMSAVLSELASGDHIFIEGDRQDSATPSRLLPTGFAAWCPKTAPSASESFHGVDRSVDQRLYGHRISAANMDVLEAIIEGCFAVQDDGDEIDHIFMHPRRFKTLVKEAEGKTWFTHTEIKGKTPAGLEFGYDAAKVRTDTGFVNVVPDRYCDYDFAAGVCMADWELRSEGAWPDFMTFDDGNLITVADADQGELRVGGDWNVVCHAPNNQVHIDFTT